MAHRLRDLFLVLALIALGAYLMLMRPARPTPTTPVIFEASVHYTG